MKITFLAAVLVVISLMWQSCSDRRNTENSIEAFTKGKVDFNFHVKPILSDKCFTCHGPDVKKRQANLRLDTEEGAFRALKSDSMHYAIIRGNSEESYLIKRIFSEDPSFRMPPPESNLVLTEQEKNILKKWII